MLLPQANKQPGFFERIWIALWSLTPPQFRRMSLLSSLYARFAECDEDDKDRLMQVNQVMHLTRDIHCMRFSVFAAPYVWGHILPIRRIDDERLDTYVTRVLKNTPCWLKYGEDETLRKDIRDLMHYCFKEQNRRQVGSTH